MERGHVPKDYADNQPSVPRYSIVHAPRHGELLVVSVVQHKAVHRRRGIETQIVETTYHFAAGTDLYGQRVVGSGELDGGKRAVRFPEKAPGKEPRRIDRFRNRNRVEAHDLTFLVDSLRLGAADAIWSINGRVGTVTQQIAMANTSHGVTANDIALRIDPEDGGKGNTGNATSTDLKLRGCLDWARAVPNGTVRPATNSAPVMVRAAILSFLISSPLIPRETLEHLTVSRTWPLFTSHDFRGTLQPRRRPVNSRRISFR